MISSLAQGAKDPTLLQVQLRSIGSLAWGRLDLRLRSKKGKKKNVAGRSSSGRGWSCKGCLAVETAFEWGFGAQVEGGTGREEGTDSSRQREPQEQRQCDPGKAGEWGVCH